MKICCCLLIAKVHIGNDTKRSFALKKVKKEYIVATKQVDHMMNEKKVLMEIHCNFVIRQDFNCSIWH